MIDVKVQVNTVRDADGKFIQGIPQIWTTPSKDFIAHMLDKKVEIPTIDCNRKGDGCSTPITELQIHNNHVPTYTDEQELIQYCHRVLWALQTECTFLGVMVKVRKGEGDNKAIVSTESILDKCNTCGSEEEVGANQEGLPMCNQCYEGYKQEGGDNDLPW